MGHPSETMRGTFASPREAPQSPRSSTTTTFPMKNTFQWWARRRLLVEDQTQANPAPEPPSAPSADNKAGAGAKPEGDPATKEAAWKQWGDRLEQQKAQIDLLSRELDVLQREYQVRAAAMYADVGNRLRNSADWDKQDAQYKQQIADKQKAVDDAKQKLDDMQEEARKAGVPASLANRKTVFERRRRSHAPAFFSCAQIEPRSTILPTGESASHDAFHVPGGTCAIG